MGKITVRQGKRYRASITLNWLQQQFATNEKLAQMFLNLGFSEVQVVGTGAVRQVSGLWPLQDASAEVPPEVDAVEEIEV